jgi:hypothetical protein
MNLKEAELALAERRLLDAGRMAQTIFEEHAVRLMVDTDRSFRVTLLLDARPLASVAGDDAVDVADAMASFVIHLSTRAIDE